MPAERPEAPLLDPFAFPSETKGRFVMLIMAALVCGGNLGFFLHTMLVSNRHILDAVRRLESATQQWWGRTIFSFGTSDLKTFAQQEAIISRASMSVLAECLILPCLTLLLLAALALAFYRNHIERLRLRYRTRPLTKAESPMVVADLESCAERFGLILPHLEYSSGLAQGHAFGVKGNEILLLHGTPAVLERSWGEANRAIALHELAHIANADLYEREKAKALWRAFVIVLVSGVALLWACGFRLSGVGLLQSVSMLVFVRALWGGLIRTREFYADWRVASWGEGATLAFLFALPEREREPWKRWNWWWAAWEQWGEQAWWNPIWTLSDWSWRRMGWLLRMHPSFYVRRRVLEDSRQLFGISLDLPLFTGILLSLVVAGSLILVMLVLSIFAATLGLIQSKLLALLADLPPGGMRDLLAIGLQIILGLVAFASVATFVLVISYFATRTIGAQLQRNAVADMVCGGSRAWGYARLLPIAFLLAIGMETGLHIVPFNLLAFGSRESWMATPLWLASFTILLWLWLAYVHGLSRMLLGSYAGRANPKLRRAVVTWSSVVLLTILFLPALLARITLQMLPLVHAAGRLFNHVELRKMFAYGLFTTTFAVLILAIVVYSIWVLAFMALLRWGPLRRRKRCPTCREETRYVLSLGRRCRSCGGSLAPWILAHYQAPASATKVRP